MVIYAVYASDGESSWIKKAFMSKEKAEAYAQQIREGNEALANVYKEYQRREDEIWELVYDRNGFNDEPLFEELHDWYQAERKSLKINPDCEDDDDTNIFVKELEVEE